ncbi:MAG TPA: endonuclease V [Elusimicrobiota bacterium]|nr:endonuclease V [Elusimicrobiota bacterium]
MRPVEKHSWGLTTEKAEDLQRTLSARLTRQTPFKDAGDVRTVAAVCVEQKKNDAPVSAAAAVFRLPDFQLLESSIVTEKPGKLFPYVPGLLSFRETPLFLKALKAVTDADVLLVPGHGLAHPRRFGIACHLGLLMDRPSIGCADEKIFGDFEEPPPGLEGAYTLLRDGDEMIGAALRTRPNTAPLFVSPGHKMGVLMAVDIVMNCVRGNRAPEPLRLLRQLLREQPPARGRKGKR